MAIDALDAIQTAVEEADFNGKSASNALYFVFVKKHSVLYREEQ